MDETLTTLPQHDGRELRVTLGNFGAWLHVWRPSTGGVMVPEWCAAVAVQKPDLLLVADGFQRAAVQLWRRNRRS